MGPKKWTFYFRDGTRRILEGNDLPWAAYVCGLTGDELRNVSFTISGEVDNHEYVNGHWVLKNSTVVIKDDTAQQLATAWCKENGFNLEDVLDVPDHPNLVVAIVVKNVF